MKTPKIKTLTIGITAATMLKVTLLLLMTLVVSTADARSYAAYRPAYRSVVRQSALYRADNYRADNARLAPPTVTFPNRAQSNRTQSVGRAEPTFSSSAIEPMPARSVALQSVGPPCDAVPHISPGVARFGSPLVTYRPLVPLVAMPRSYQVGRGILGQVKVYVPGQPIRNALRYLTP